jgi:hypothetical protein
MSLGMFISGQAGKRRASDIRLPFGHHAHQFQEQRQRTRRAFMLQRINVR